MPELVTSIRLSSGTVLRIPIIPDFPEKELPNNYAIASRAACVICEQTSNSIVYQLSDDDMLELFNLCFGKTALSLDMNPPQTAGIYISQLVWYKAVSIDDDYRLAIPFVSYVSGPELAYEQYNGVANLHYWNSTNNAEPTGSQDFYEKANRTNNEVAPLYNIRKGGVYSLDVAYKCQPATISFAGTSFKMPTLVANFQKYLEDHPDADIEFTVYDPEDNDDPYIVDDPSGIGGGDGSRDDPDEIEKAEIPPLPSISAVDTGLITMYGATLPQLQALGSYLWSDLWDIETNFKKLFSDPMNCLIGLSIVPVRPSMGAGTNVKFGNITTNIALNKLTSQYVEVDCGSLSINEYIGSFLDYSPYVNISIYLPYIGYRELSPDDVMKDTIHVVYHVDVLTGGCCAMIETAKKGLLYSYNGSCCCNVPITAINYSGAIQNAVSAIGSGVTTAVGIATGAAPIAAVGAASMLSNAANTAMNSKPSIQRSGNMGGSAGLMSYQKPLLVITRPRMSVPAKLNKFTGLTSNITMNLSTCKGFTQIEMVHLDSVPCTADERRELLTLLKQGVIF